MNQRITVFVDRKGYYYPLKVGKQPNATWCVVVRQPFLVVGLGGKTGPLVPNLPWRAPTDTLFYTFYPSLELSITRARENIS